MKALEEFRSFLSATVGKGGINKLAKAAGVQQASLSKFIHGKQDSLDFSTVSKIMEYLGVSLRLPADTQSREVCFVNVKSPMTKDDDFPVAQENYVVIPLLSEAGAGPGIIRSGYEETEEWFMVNRSAQSMFGRQVEKFFAVRIANRSTSMEPTLHPGDTVLVDPTDKRIDKPGGIFLVMEPDGSGKIKRVNIERVPSLRVTRLTFYSDNVAENPPEAHILEHDYEGDIDRAIVGRVIWAWTDLSRK